MRVLLDMNISPRWTTFLAGAGIQSEHWSAIGAPAASDSEIMAYAKANGHVVLTHDLDFSAILAATHGEKPSVVQIRADDVSMEAIGNQITSALLQMASELEQGALLTIDPKRTRLRLLPLPLKD
jgi:predicted nuclease of predicted toxin-antitoxin system